MLSLLLLVGGCVSPEDETAGKKIYCDEWSKSAKNKYSLQFAYQPITGKGLFTYSRIHENDLFLDDLNAYVKELDDKCNELAAEEG